MGRLAALRVQVSAPPAGGGVCWVVRSLGLVYPGVSEEGRGERSGYRVGGLAAIREGAVIYRRGKREKRGSRHGLVVQGKVAVFANLPTCRLFDLSGSWRLGELAGCGECRPVERGAGVREIRRAVRSQVERAGCRVGRLGRVTGGGLPCC